MSRLLGFLVPLFIVGAVVFGSADNKKSSGGLFVRRSLQQKTSAVVAASSPMPPILSHPGAVVTATRPNAIVYLAQKKHSSYDRDSYGLLIKSLDLLYKNYLLLNDQYKNVNVYIFYTGDFDVRDLESLEGRYPEVTRGTLRLVNLQDTEFWRVPDFLKDDDQKTWRGSDQYAIGYRHMIRFYALKIWDFFDQLNQEQPKANVRYIMRLDEESFLHSPISYDLFRFMQDNSYSYGFRMCSYEIGTVLQAWDHYVREAAPPGFRPNRSFRGGLCGFYNNFFIADLQFFLSKQVQEFLRFVDSKGYMYRHRTNDLVLQTAAVYAFAPETAIHRFLDFSYEHFTLYKSGCPRWGAIEAGYNDPNGAQLIQKYKQDVLALPNKCPFNDPERSYATHEALLGKEDLSPTYSHLPPHLKEPGALKLPVISAGTAESPNKGNKSSG